MSGYDVAPRGSAGPIDLAVSGPYDVTVHGPDGFVTYFAGNTLTGSAGVEVTADVADDVAEGGADGVAESVTEGMAEDAAKEVVGGKGTLRLTASNGTRHDVELSIRDLLARGGKHGEHGNSTTLRLAAGTHETMSFDPVRTARGWYDLSVTIADDPTFMRRFAGRIATGPRKGAKQRVGG